MKTLNACFLRRLNIFSAGLMFARRRAAATVSAAFLRHAFVSHSLGLILVLGGISLPSHAIAGSWLRLTNLAPDSIDTMLLLSDGTVMAASGTTSSGNIGNAWYRLTPDIHGSYVNGTWTTLAPMHDTRLYYASQVLQDGRVFIAGGEYGSGATTAEIYDPLNNTWTVTAASGQQFIDCESRLLPDGNVLVSPVFSNPPGTQIIYHPALDTWTPGGTLVRGNTLDEASWIKLPDDSILTLDLPGTGTNSERYIPSLNQWVDDGTLPVSPWELVKFEMGAGFMLPDGRGFYLGSSGHTVFYAPSDSTSPGSFTAGPDIPNGQGTPDAPAAMLVTGKILCTFAPNGTVGGATNFPGPTTFYEFDPVANTFNAQSTPTGSADPNPPFPDRMLDLPDGTVLFASSDSQLYVYKPTGAPLAAGKPTITSITPNADGSYHLIGTLLNGISEGAQYGDDAQMNSNYPLVRMTDAQGNVYYARTHGWSSTSIMTGAKPLSTEFTVPAGVPAGTYSLVVVANGISSDPVQFSGIATPDLVVSTNIVFGGNGNGIIDFNECNSLFVVITNKGGTNATSVRATLSTTTPGVTVDHASVQYPNIAAGAVATNINPFQISTAPNFVCGTPIYLTLVVKCDQTTAADIFTLDSGAVGTTINLTNQGVVSIIPGSTGVDSITDVTNIDSALKHVAVAVDVFESFDFNLTLQLIGPDGTTVTLAQGDGGSGQSFGIDCSDQGRTIFDDTASSSISSNNAPFIGTFQPVGKLSVFNGKSGSAVNGTWRLHAMDAAGNDSGAIECWVLLLTPSQCVDGGGQCPGVDLGLTMTGLPNPVLVQSNLTYTMTVTNNGPDTATSVSLSQTLPSGVTFVSANSSQGSCSQSSNLVNCNLGTLLVGATATVTVVVVPNTPGTIFSTATVGAQEPDGNQANNTATTATLVSPPTADVAVTLTANPNPVLLNGILTYTASVVNNGPSVALNVVVTNTFPPTVIISSTGASQGTNVSSANVVVANLGSLPVGSNAIVTIRVVPFVAGGISATAHVSSDVGDPYLPNNTSSVNTTVTLASDLVLKLTGPTSAIVGSNLTYLVTVQNLGPSAATGLNIKDTLPPGVSFVQATSPQGNCSISGNVVNCLVSNLAVSANATVSITVGTSNLLGSVPVTIADTASVTADQADPNTTNNTASLSTLVTTPMVNVVAAGSVLLSESFVPTNGMIEPGEKVTVLLRLQNIGNIDTASNLIATLLNTGGVVPSGAQVQNYGTLTTGGAAIGLPFTFVSGGTNGGTINASLQLQNGGTNLPQLVTFTFKLPATNSFINTNNITIPDHGPGLPYPSSNVVSGVTGLIGKVTVTMTNVNHTFPDDVDMLLVGPGGQSVLLMSHAGNNGVLTNASLTFDDGVTNANGTPKYLPASSQILSGSYVPSQYGTVSFPTNTPASPYGTNLALFNGTNPNGVWRLFVFDSMTGDGGVIVGGWSLGITAGSEVNPVVDLAVSGSAKPNPVLNGANLTYTFTITNNGPNPAGLVQFTNLLPANVSFVSATNSAHTICAVDGSGAVYCSLTNMSAGSNVTVTIVVAPNSPGTITSVATVSGSDSDPNQSNNSATVITTATVPVADLSVTLSGAANAVVGSNVLYTITVTNNGPGAALGVVVKDALSGSVSFLGGSSSLPSVNPSATNGAVICNLGTLANGASATVSLLLNSTQAITFTNIASATTTSSDTNLVNNTNVVVTVFNNPAPNIVAAGSQLVSSLPNGTLASGLTATISFQLANLGTADTTNLVATLLAGNGVVSPSGAKNYGALLHGGPAIARNFTFTAGTTSNGVIIATLQLVDGTNQLGTVNFNFNLPATNSFANTNAIIIPDFGPASPYPSAITISNVIGLVSQATVTLNRLSHQFPNDVEILLVSPSGKSVVLMSGTGGGNVISNVVLTFDDAATTNLPASGQFGVGTPPIVSGKYLPTDEGISLAFPSPAPGGTYGANMAALNGGNANGTWTLYVLDNSSGDSGSIAQGWSLTLTTVNPINSAADLGVSLTKLAGSIFEGSAFTYTVNVTNKGPINAANVVLTNTLPPGVNVVGSSLSYTNGLGGTLVFNLGTLPVGNNATFTITLKANASGTYQNTINVSSDQADLNPQDNTAQSAFAVLGGPRLTATKGTNNNAFALNLALTGQIGTYNILATTNIGLSLSNWTVVGTITNTVGIIHYTDTNAAGFPYRYYRAVLIP